MTDVTTLCGKRVFLTGGTGFIGRHLLDRLSAVGARVHAVSRGQQPDGRSGIQWYQANMADLPTTRTLLEAIKPHVIYHLAGHVVGTRSTDAIVPTFQSNLMTTVNLLTVAQAVGCERFVLPGSLEEPLIGRRRRRSELSLCGHEMGWQCLCPHVPCALPASCSDFTCLYGLWPGSTRRA